MVERKKGDKENEMLAFLYLSIGNKRRKSDVIKIAEICKKLSLKYPPKKLAEILGVNYEIIRGFLSIANLSPKVKEKIKKYNIPFDVAQRLSRIKSEKLQLKVIEMIKNVSSSEAREIIQYAKKFPSEDLEKFKHRLKTYRKKEKIVVILLPLKKDEYTKLAEIAKKENLSVENFIIKKLKELVI